MRVSRDMAYHQVECRIWNFNIRRRSADKKILESENPLASNNVGSRWETGRGNSLIKDTANAALTKFSEHISDKFKTIGFRRSYGCAAS